MNAAGPDTVVRILGIDPGSRATGYGLVELSGRKLRYLESGVIRSTGQDFNVRLAHIFAAAQSFIDKAKPDELAIERVFVKKNPDSALKLGAARAAVICASFALGPDVHEYAAREIKQALTGRGSADKDQVQHMVKAILNLQGSQFGLDESDALAIAICHAHSRDARQAVKAASA